MKPTRAQKRPIGNRIVQRRRAAHLVAQSARARQASEDFTLFFAQSPDLMCVAGLDGYFLDVNAAWTSRLGWTSEELEAKPFMDFVHPDDRESTTAEFQKLAAGATTILFENRYRHRNGSYRCLQWSAWPVPGRRRVHATARDITRQKRLEIEVLEIADREKERLGRELHDGLCQSLAGIAALSSTLSKRLVADSKSDAFVVSTDLYPTILEMAGLNLMPEQHKDGRSFVEVLKQQKKESRSTLYFHYPHKSHQGGRPSSSIRVGDYKLIDHYEDNNHRLELFNLAEDIGENNNLADSNPERVNSLLGMLQRWQEESGAKFPEGYSKIPGIKPVPEVPVDQSVITRDQ